MKGRERSYWSGPQHGPWPALEVKGDLERAEAEWLHTNGAGAYAMSTVALMHTRRNHGLLVAALKPPLERYVVLSHAESTVKVGGRSYRLATHQFPDIAPTPGYRLIESFAMDPLPRWVCRLGKGTLERTLSLVRGQNAVVLSYTWSAKQSAELTVRPLMPLRPVEELMHEHGGMKQTVTLRPGEVEVQPAANLPPLNFSHGGVFMGAPDWWRRFEYLEDRVRHSEFQEDMWTPGTFEITLHSNQTQYIVMSVGPLPAASAHELVMEAAEHILAQDPGPKYSGYVRSLCVAADQFSARSADDEVVIAGYPWLDVWSRDAAIALPGIYLCRGRVDDAKRCVSTLIRHMHSGMLPQTIRFQSRKRPEFAPDATLWLFEIARELDGALDPADPFMQRELFPALKRVFVRVRAARKRWMWLSHEGLVENGEQGTALTWMDARVGSRLFTPRSGLAIELQALWTRGCQTLALLAQRFGDHETRSAALAAREQAVAAFRARFWCRETQYPFDCVSATPQGGDAWADPAIRPNAMIALAVDAQLFDAEQREAIMVRCKKELLTPRGIRSLSPFHPDYVGHFAGDPDERVSAFHQGTVWPYLLGFYVRAALATYGRTPSVIEELRSLVEGALSDRIVLGQVAQVADADPPNRPRGCPAQAFSVAELLRALTVDLARPSAGDTPPGIRASAALFPSE
ncbi:MAG TPA: amylo-alpha-1,6-glucosidase [Polyangiaceae bacterium]